MSENNHKPPEKKEVQKRADAKLISGDIDKDECKIIERIIAKLHIGPLPPPETLEGYNKLLPNATGRIFQMAEKSQMHFHEKEKYLIESERKKIDKGQNFALVVSVVALVGAVLCAAFHEPVVGTVIGALLWLLWLQIFYQPEVKEMEWILRKRQMIARTMKKKTLSVNLKRNSILPPCFQVTSCLALFFLPVVK
jgi:uncharacterized membrane protein